MKGPIIRPISKYEKSRYMEDLKIKRYKGYSRDTDSSLFELLV